MKKVLSICLFVFVIVLFSLNCFADDVMLLAKATPQRELLMFTDIPIVTSVSKHEQSILEAPAAISVITSDDIKNMDYANLWDLFRRVPGVDVSTYDGRRGAVAPRGFSEVFTRRNQLLIDGRSSYTPLFGGTEWDYIPIFPENIERIEVIRGPNATLYGSNAFSGVINIITKKPEDTQGTTLKQTIGTHDYTRSMVRFGNSTGNFDYRATYAYHFDNGYGSRDGKDLNDKQRDHTFTWRSVYNIDDESNLEFFFGDKEDDGRPLAVTTKSTNNQSDTRSDFQMIRYNTKVFDDQDFYVQLFRNEVLENRHGAVYLYDKNNSETRQYDLEVQHSFDWLDDAISTVWGSNFRHNSGEFYLMNGSSDLSTRYDGKGVTDRIFRVFMNNEIKLNEKLKFIPGLMYETNDFVGESYSPRVSLMFAPTENRMFRASYARAYRTPTMLEDTQNFAIAIIPSVLYTYTKGNRELENEVVDAYELGYTSYLLDKKLTLDAQIYYNEYNNLFHVYMPTTTVATFNNANTARGRGIELSTEYRPNDWSKFYVNATHAVLNDTLAVYENSMPKFKVNLGTRLDLKEKGITINLDGYYVDTYVTRDFENTSDKGTEVDPYFRVDFRIAKTFFDGDLEWAIRGENILDQSHVEAKAGSSAGIVALDEIERAIYTSLTAKF